MIAMMHFVGLKHKWPEILFSVGGKSDEAMSGLESLESSKKLTF